MDGPVLYRTGRCHQRRRRYQRAGAVGCQRLELCPASDVSPAALLVAPGQSATVSLAVTDPATAGDTAESLVISSAGGQTTVPVTIRSAVSLGPDGGSFGGTVTGGDGRYGIEAQSNTFYFSVPPGRPGLDHRRFLGQRPPGAPDRLSGEPARRDGRLFQQLHAVGLQPGPGRGVN